MMPEPPKPPVNPTRATAENQARTSGKINPPRRSPAREPDTLPTARNIRLPAALLPAGEFWDYE
jgi:hypothetical protein